MKIYPTNTVSPQKNHRNIKFGHLHQIPDIPNLRIDNDLPILLRNYMVKFKPIFKLMETKGLTLDVSGDASRFEMNLFSKCPIPLSFTSDKKEIIDTIEDQIHPDTFKTAFSKVLCAAVNRIVKNTEFEF